MKPPCLICSMEGMTEKLTSFQKKWIYLIPGLFFTWGWILTKIERPFFLSRMDPEYLYLLNGMNCAIFNFNRIGHFDNPGTPFQILSGFFIRIIHFFVGKKPLVDNVLTRPELYLYGMSFMLLCLTTVVLIWMVDCYIGLIIHTGRPPFYKVV